jgi:hypothetical protein
MKVLDLQCGNGHTFEGWFGSEDAFMQQHAQSMVACPVCASMDINKLLSAPRLNLVTSRRDSSSDKPESDPSAAATPVEAKAATAAWMAMGRQILESTADVGSAFPEEARRMHYGEAEHRPIRGTSTLDEAIALVEEGVPILPLLLPEAFKGPLQ